jgi:hypothetical protein
VHGPSLGLTQFLLNQVSGRSLLNALQSRQPELPLELALDYWLRVLVAILALAVILSIRGRLSTVWLIRLFGLAVIALLVLYGHFGTRVGVATED